MPKSLAPSLPRTLQRSSPEAQHLYAAAREGAERQYGPGERAARTAFAALKQRFEKIGDHWEAKAEPGPSDSRSLQSSADKRRGKGETFGGVDVLGHTRQELYERARGLGIRGRSTMNKEELARAIAAKQ